MIRLLASLMLITGISVSAPQACVGEELHVHAHSADTVSGHSSGEHALAPAALPQPAVEEVAQDFFSWKEISVGTVLLLSPAALGLAPVDWASVAELIGQLF